MANQMSSMQFIGLPAVLPYINLPINGVDVGAYIVNNMHNLLTAGSVNILFAEDPPVISEYMAWSPLSIEFTGAPISFRLDMLRSYRAVWNPHCGPYVCQEP